MALPVAAPGGEALASGEGMRESRAEPLALPAREGEWLPLPLPLAVSVAVMRSVGLAERLWLGVFEGGDESVAAVERKTEAGGEGEGELEAMVLVEALREALGVAEREAAVEGLCVALRVAEGLPEVLSVRLMVGQWPMRACRRRRGNSSMVAQNQA